MLGKSFKSSACVQHTGPSVEHFLLDVVDMQTGSLTQWVTINHRATHLLDVNTMVSYEKQDVFIP